jgi:hypothetical protein
MLFTSVSHFSLGLHYVFHFTWWTFFYFVGVSCHFLIGLHGILHCMTFVLDNTMTNSIV